MKPLLTRGLFYGIGFKLNNYNFGRF